MKLEERIENLCKEVSNRMFDEKLEWTSIGAPDAIGFLQYFLEEIEEYILRPYDEDQIEKIEGIIDEVEEFLNQDKKEAIKAVNKFFKDFGFEKTSQIAKIKRVKDGFKFVIEEADIYGIDGINTYNMYYKNGKLYEEISEGVFEDVNDSIY